MTTSGTESFMPLTWPWRNGGIGWREPNIHLPYSKSIRASSILMKPGGLYSSHNSTSQFPTFLDLKMCSFLSPEKPEPVIPAMLIVRPIQPSLDEQISEANASLSECPSGHTSVHPSGQICSHLCGHWPIKPAHCCKFTSGGQEWHWTGEGLFKDVLNVLCFLFLSGPGHTLERTSTSLLPSDTS